jgi:O-antigen/teichoic acid export membrane protein
LLLKLGKLIKNPGFLKYFRNTSWLLAEKFFRLITGFIVGIWVVRYLGPENFGHFSFAQSFVGLFVVFASLGLDSILVRELVKNDIQAKKLIGTAFTLKIIAAAITILFVNVSIRLASSDDLTHIIVFILVSATLLQSLNVVDFYFQSLVLSRFVVLVKTVSISTISLIKIILILYEAPLIAFAFVVALESFFLAIGFIYIFIFHGLPIPIKSLSFCKDTAVLFLRSSWPLLLSGLTVSVYMKIDQIMIKNFLDVEAVGHYAAAVRISELWHVIPMVIAASLFPAIVTAKNISQDLYHQRLQVLFSLIVWMALLMALAVTAGSNAIIEALYGDQYAPAAEVLIAHIWTAVAVGFGIIWSKWLIVENKQQMVIIFHIVALILNISLNLYLIPVLGILGAGIATALSSIIAQLTGVLFYQRDRALQFLIYSFFPKYLFRWRV